MKEPTTQDLRLESESKAYELYVTLKTIGEATAFSMLFLAGFDVLQCGERIGRWTRERMAAKQ